MKQAYHHKDLRNALVDEAIALLADGGSGNITLRELSRRLGVTHTAAYAHFADKKALLEAVAESGFSRLADALAAARASHADPAVALERMGSAYIAFARENANWYRLMFADPELVSDPECEMSAEGGRAFAELSAVVAALGPPPETDVLDLSVAIWAQVHGIAMLEIDARIDMKTMNSAEDVLQLATRLFVRGIRGGESH